MTMPSSALRINMMRNVAELLDCDGEVIGRIDEPVLMFDGRETRPWTAYAAASDGRWSAWFCGDDVMLEDGRHGPWTILETEEDARREGIDVQGGEEDA